MRPAVYATREQVKTALDSVETARNNRRIDRLIRSASDDVEKLTLRTFYPMVDTRVKDWPLEWDQPQAWRIWLDDDELVSLASVSVDGVALAAGTYFPRPDTGPPFDRIELDRGKNAAWSSGRSPQRAISVSGVFGYELTEVPASTLAAAVTTTTATTVQINASWEIGVGSLIKVGTERMNVTNRSMVTTGQALQVPMDAQALTTSCVVVDGTKFVEDEVILIGAEKMRVDEIAGNTLVVKRAWDGTVLAAHNAQTIYSPRQLTVDRGACGTTPATHLINDPVLLFRPPDLINQLCIAEAVVALLQESAGYARVVGSGDNQREAAGRELTNARARVKSGFYRFRKGAI